MRSNFWPLLKVQMIQSRRGLIESMTGTKSRWGMLLLPLIGLGFIPLIVMFTFGWIALYAGLAYLGQSEMVIMLALTAGQLVCLIFGILYVISAFYFSKDLKGLIPLPLRPGEIVLSKFAGIMVGEYLSMAPFVIPALAVYGVMADVGLLYIPFAIIIYLLLPVLPLVLSSLFSMALMRVTNLRRNRDLVRVFGAVIGIGFAFGFQFIGRLQGSGDPQAAVDRLLQEQQPLMQSLGKWAITSVWGTQALQEGAPLLGLPGLLLFTAAALAALFLLIQVAERVFFGGLLGGDEAASSGRRLTREELARGTSQTRSPLWALFLREVRLLNRTPAFLMSGVLPPLMVPIFMIMPLSSPGGPLENPAALRAFSEGPWFPVVLLGVTLFVNSMSAIPSSAISREGRWFWISRSLPVPPRVQVQAKMIHSLAFSLVTLLMLVGIMTWLGLATPRNVLVVLVGGLLTGAVTGYAGLIVDVLRPSLAWTDPQQAMKGNMNALFAMAINVGIAVVTGLGALLLYWLVRPLLFPGLLLILALETWGLSVATGALAEKRYMEYEL